MDVVRSVIYPMIKDKRNCYVLKMRLATRREAHFNGNHVSRKLLSSKVVPSLYDDTPLKYINFVFLGTEESYLGFLTCFILKYGAETISGTYLYMGLDDDLKRKLDETLLRWKDSQTCIFVHNPRAVAYITVRSSDVVNKFSTINVDEFLDGYRKMAEVNVDGIINRDINSIYINYKALNHPKGCRMCGEPALDAPELEHLFTTSTINAPRQCSSYWYYM